MNGSDLSEQIGCEQFGKYFAFSESGTLNPNTFLKTCELSHC